MIIIHVFVSNYKFDEGERSIIYIQKYSEMLKITVWKQMQIHQAKIKQMNEKAVLKGNAV